MWKLIYFGVLANKDSDPRPEPIPLEMSTGEAWIIGGFIIAMVIAFLLCMLWIEGIFDRKPADGKPKRTICGLRPPKPPK